MNNTKMPTWQDGKAMSNSKISGLIGTFFILSLLVSVLNWSLILSGFISVDDALKTAQNILANEFLFRLSIFNEIVSVVIILTLSAFLYVLLKSTNANLSVLGLSFRIVETILYLLIAFLHLILLFGINEQDSLFLNQNAIRQFSHLILEQHVQLTFIPGIFFGLGMLIFSYLLLKSKLIPERLAIFGIIAYLLTCLYDTTSLIFPEFSEIIITQIVFIVPMCVFQITIGIRLLFKGIKK